LAIIFPEDRFQIDKEGPPLSTILILGGIPEKAQGGPLLIDLEPEDRS